MSGMGRARLPDAVKAARGTLQRCRTNPNAPTPPVLYECPPAPARLSRREAKVWDELGAVVFPTGVVTVADLRAFGLTVCAVANADVAARDPKASVGAKAAATKLALLLLGDFGATPASRSKVPRATRAAPGADLAEFLS